MEGGREERGRRRWSEGEGERGAVGRRKEGVRREGRRRERLEARKGARREERRNMREGKEKRRRGSDVEATTALLSSWFGCATVSLTSIEHRYTAADGSMAFSFVLSRRFCMLSFNFCPKLPRYPSTFLVYTLSPPLLFPSPTSFFALSSSHSTCSFHLTSPVLVIHPHLLSFPPFPPSGTLLFASSRHPRAARSVTIREAFRASERPEWSRPWKGGRVREARTEMRFREEGAVRRCEGR